MVVADLAKSKQYFTALGYTFNSQFTDETAACLVISPHLNAMLLLPETMKRFTTKRIIDPKSEVEALFAYSCASRADVDAIAVKAIAVGGMERRPAEDLEFMYSRAIEDLDGHTWEYFWYDESKK
jgi:predicted lactoylglutathione lyase